MDLIPGYPNYLDPGYQFPESVTSDDVSPGLAPADRQRSLSGDRVVILPRRPSEAEPCLSPEWPQPGHGGHGGHQPGQQREWRVPPHSPPESLYPGEFSSQLRCVSCQLCPSYGW